MCNDNQTGFFLDLLVFCALICYLPFVASQCNVHHPVIFYFGDSNSDTGGYSVATGTIFDYPDGRAFFHKPTGRTCDGRLIIDFLCENLNTSYLTPYLDSIEPNFTNGVNFAFSGSSLFKLDSTSPKYIPFTLDVQVLQFKLFQNRSLELQSKGYKNLVGQEDFKNALYTIDIGQNDLANAFNSLPYVQVIDKIPSFISAIKDAMLTMYQAGGRNFWVHNTGPLGCLPQELGATKKPNATDFDQNGCIKSLNEGAKVFNTLLNALCQELRPQMKDSTIVYVDIYSIKYDLVANSASYGFKNPLAACCGFGGGPYNYDPINTCRGSKYTVCEEGSPYISWDGVHYAEAANAIVASKILSTNYSTPPLKLDYFCNKNV